MVVSWAAKMVVARAASWVASLGHVMAAMKVDVLVVVRAGKLEFSTVVSLVGKKVDERAAW